VRESRKGKFFLFGHNKNKRNQISKATPILQIKLCSSSNFKATTQKKKKNQVFHNLERESEGFSNGPISTKLTTELQQWRKLTITTNSKTKSSSSASSSSNHRR
jgi:hypothetical protein